MVFFFGDQCIFQWAPLATLFRFAFYVFHRRFMGHLEVLTLGHVLLGISRHFTYHVGSYR
jgi:hypothetical protein